MADDDDDDMGTSFMQQHMSEAQPSREAGGFGRKRAAPAVKGTDQYYENRYGGGDKSLAMDPGPLQTPNRGAKGNKR